MISFAADRRAGGRRATPCANSQATRCARSRASATRRRRSPTTVLAQPGSSGSRSRPRSPRSYGGGGEARSPVTNAHRARGARLRRRRARDRRAGAVALRQRDRRSRHRGAEAELPAALLRRAPPGGDRAVVEPHARLRSPRAAHQRRSRRAQGFVLSGVKCFVPIGDRASHFLVIARNNGGLDAFIVPRDAAGLSISEVEKNLGLKALPTASARARARRVPATATARRRDRLRRRADHQPARGRARGAVMVGLSRAVLEYCVPYAKERVAFDEPIAQKQSIAFRLAEMHIEIESMRWLTWKAAAELEHGRDATRSAHLAARLRGRQVDVDRRQRRPGARRPRLHPRAPGRDVVPQRPHPRRSSKGRDRQSEGGCCKTRRIHHDRFRAYRERPQGARHVARRGADRAASTRATTTRTSTSSRPTSCPRPRTIPTS